MRREGVQVSVIIPVGERLSPVEDFYAQYKLGLNSLELSYEIIFVVDGPHAEFEAALATLAATGETFTVVTLTRAFGDATALMVGFEHTSGSVIVTLPAYLQIEGAEIKTLVQALDSADIAVGCRHPRAGGFLETFRRNVFHGLLASVTGVRFNDLGCNARALKRKVFEEIPLYGDQQRFLPVLAERQGFRVSEIRVQQSPRDRHAEVYRPRNYTRGFLDIFSIFFLVRFTRKPLRFFGMVGVGTFAIGILSLFYIVFERIAFHQSLADRPALLLVSLLIVMGVQVFALGLLGELIIFAHAGNTKDYQVERVIQFPQT